MARFRRRMTPVINSNKHYVTRSNVVIASSGIRNDVIANAVVAPANSATNEVEEGSIVKAVYIELWIVGSGAVGTIGQYNLAIEKKPANAPVMTFTNSVNLGSYLNKKNILFAAQANITSVLDGGLPIPVFRQWILIPKGKQRMGLGDDIVVNTSATGQEIQLCGLFTYKEFR